MMVAWDWNLDRSTARAARSVVRAVLCAALLGLAACGGPIAHGELGPNGYTSGYGYDISQQAGTASVLPKAWNIDNYRFEGGKRVRKTQNHPVPYVTKYGFDDDGDGRSDHDFKAFTYALRYVHSVHSGAIWLRNIPISAKSRNKDLRVLMQDYIDGITLATYETAQLSSAARPVVVEHRQAAVIVEQGTAIMAGQPAYAATLDVANVDQLKLDPGARTQRIQLVLMRALQDEKIVRDEQDPRKTLTYPVVVLAGYSNMPPDFQTGLNDFHEFLRRLTIGGKSGLTLNTAPSQPPATPSASVAAPVAPQPATATTPPASPQ